MRVVVVGNGILGLQIARRLLLDDPSITVQLVGPKARPGAASPAAAAMFNSFCEVDADSLDDPIERRRFDFNRLSNDSWPNLLDQLREESGREINAGFGTFLINNSTTDSLEEENFDAVIRALTEYGEPFDYIDPRNIPRYAPHARQRALRSIFIPREGWVNPHDLLAALEVALSNFRDFHLYDTTCEKIMTAPSGEVTGIVTAHGQFIGADVVVLSPGATFTEIVERSNLGIYFQRMFFGAGCSLLLQTGDSTLSNCVRTPNRGLACGIYAAPQTPSTTLVGASNFISPTKVSNPRATSVYTLLRSAIEQLNSAYYKAELVRVNFGWRPTTQDTLPLLGRSEISNLIVAGGTKRDGLHCSPVIAQVVSDLVRGLDTQIDIELYRPNRKPLRTLSREQAIAKLTRHTMNAAYQHDFDPGKARMGEDLEHYYRVQFQELHNQIGAFDWGIPPEMKDMYRYGHAEPLSPQT